MKERKRKPARINSIRRNWDLYLFLLPAVVLIFCFSYIPMYGILIAFEDYSPSLGVLGSPWVGLEHFKRFFRSYQASSLISNTVILSVYSMVITFPLPIALALLLNQMRSQRFKKVVQTVTYMPHFISVVVIVSMLNIFLSPTSGLYGNIARLLGQEPQNIMGNAQLFRPLYVWSDVWQHTGWDSIIYLAALSNVDPTLYEAATIDGAGRWKKIIHLDIPAILPTCVTLLILRVGGVMNVGFEKAYLMQNSLNKATSEIISTYVYKVGLISGQFGISTAVGMFNTLVNLILLIAVNWVSRRVSETSLW